MKFLVYSPSASAASNIDSVRIVTVESSLMQSAATGVFDAVIVPGDCVGMAAAIRDVCDSVILLLIDAAALESSKVFVEDCTVDGLVFTDRVSVDTESMVITSLAAGNRAAKIVQLEDEIEALETRVASFTSGRLRSTRFIVNKAARMVAGISTISTIIYQIIKLLWN